MTRTAPAFQFYAEDFFCGVVDMTDEEVGIYIRLLAVCWSKNGVSASMLWSITANTALANDILSRKFDQQADGTWNHKRLIEQRELHEKRKRAGSKGGSKRQANRVANDVAKQGSPTPSPAPSPNTSPLSPRAEIPCLDKAQGFTTEWSQWCLFRLAQDGRPMNEIQADTVLMELTRRGVPKARADLTFSIQKGAKSVLDSDNDFDANRASRGNGHKPKESRF